MTEAVTSKRIVVVHGAAGHRLVEALRSVGLEPIATIGEVTTWAPALVPVTEAPSDREPDPLALSFGDAARRLGVSRSTVYRLVESGALNTVHLGRSVRIPLSSLDDLLARRTDRRDLAGSS